MALSDGFGDVVVKGPDLGVVFSEAAGYTFATGLGIPVPPFGVCQVPGEDGLSFCCKKLRGRFPIDHWVEHELAANNEMIPQTIVFDIWVGNHDRNMGNFIEDAGELRAAGQDDGTMIFAIDFEKSAVLRGEPDWLTLNAWPATRFWPSDDLGRLCRRFEPSEDCMAKIEAMSDDEIDGTLRRVHFDMDAPTIPWLDRTIRTLSERRDRLRDLVHEAWP